MYIGLLMFFMWYNLATSSLTCAVNLQSESAYAYTGSFLIQVAVQINEFRCYEAKIEESEKAGSRRESNPGHLWLEPPVLCHWATTAGQPPTPTILLCILHRWYWMPQSHIRQPLSMCRQNSVRGRLENSLHQERTHPEWFFSLLNAESILPHTGNKWI